MADDVTLNSMSGGVVVATDDSGTGHVQIIKLAYSADGSRVPITADANGLKVNVGNTVTVTLGAALPAGSAVIGAVTQSGTWNVGAITTLPALATGTNTVGYVMPKSGATLSQGSAAPTATATSIVASSSTRRTITITNTGTVTVNVGGSGVTASTGVPLVAGASATFDGAAAAQFYGITASGTGAVVYIGESD